MTNIPERTTSPRRICRARVVSFAAETIFQLMALYILYNVSKTMVSGFFASAPWAYPLIFLAMALIPTVKVVVAVVHALEGQNAHKQAVTRDQY